MKKHDIVMLGAGNAATHLAHQFRKAGHRILQVFSKSEASAEFLAEEVHADFTDALDKIDKTASLYVIAVNDDAVEQLAEQLHFPKGIVVHTSAIIPMEALEPVSGRIGVFYPLQTMTKGSELNFREVPVFIEASDEQVRKELLQLAGTITTSVHDADLEKRKTLHIAAVFANNFTNHLFHIAEVLLKRNDMPLSLLLPLIRETVNKLEGNNPFAVQTGPAKRGDLQTIEEHLEYLKEYPDFREIYLVLTESLLSAYRKEDEHV